MSLEQQVREQLDVTTRDVPGGPDLAAAITRGRRLRRRRHGLVLAGGAPAVVAATAAVAPLLLGGPGSTDHDVATDPSSGAGATVDTGGIGGVSGTDRDDILATVVARQLPGLPAADYVYPSDWDHAGPMPDADHADATDWQATYTVSAHEDLLVFSGYAPPDQQADPGCAGPVTVPGQPTCQHQGVSGGAITYSSYEDGNSFVFYTAYVGDGGFAVTAIETVTADSWQQAGDRRAFSADDLRPLVTDRDLVFPLPESRS